jgi:hypothetical protein
VDFRITTLAFLDEWRVAAMVEEKAKASNHLEASDD